MRTFLILLILTTSISLIFFVSCQSTEKSAQNQGKNAEVEKVVSLTTAEKMENIKRDLVVVKAELAQAGEYNCCIQPACDWCALHEGDCECQDNLKAGKPVCPDCGLGWHNGKGVVAGVTASQVKWDITHEHAEGEHLH